MLGALRVKDLRLGDVRLLTSDVRLLTTKKSRPQGAALTDSVDPVSSRSSWRNERETSRLLSYEGLRVFSCRAIGFLKFRISIADFFGAFKEGGEGIGGFGKGPEGILLKGDEIGCVAFLQFFGECREEFLPGFCLDLLILFVEAGSEVFHRCREVTGEDFAGIVVEGEHGAVLGICRLMEDVLPDEGEGVGDHGGLESVLGVILGDGAAHKAPAGDVFQARHVGKEGIAHFILPHVSP